MPAGTEFLLALGFLFVRGFFAGAEVGTAGVSLQRAKEIVRERPSSAARALLWIKERPEAGSIASRSGGSVGLALAVASACFGALRLTGQDPAPVFGAALLVVLASTALDMLPRSLAAARPERWALLCAVPLRAAAQIAWPVVKGFAWAEGMLLKSLDAQPTFTPPPPPPEEIERLAAEATKGTGAPGRDLIHAIFTFGKKTAKEITVPRTDVQAIEIDTPPMEVVRILSEEGHTRMPVYRGDIDHIVGVLHAKDVVPLMANPQLIVLEDLLRPIHFVPWSKSIGELMREMQRKRTHLAGVVDEYGGFMGVVTLEDILEQIVGEIRDEFDAEEEREVAPQADGSALVRAEMRVADFNKSLGAAVPESEAYETLGGFLSAIAGYIPQVGERLVYDGMEFTVTRRDDRRVTQVKVQKPRPAPAPLPVS
jgi:CBS domain containing-hemolysin-like protein